MWSICKFLWTMPQFYFIMSQISCCIQDKEMVSYQSTQISLFIYSSVSIPSLYFIIARFSVDPEFIMLVHRLLYYFGKEVLGLGTCWLLKSRFGNYLHKVVAILFLNWLVAFIRGWYFQRNFFKKSQIQIYRSAHWHCLIRAFPILLIQNQRCSWFYWQTKK